MNPPVPQPVAPAAQNTTDSARYLLYGEVADRIDASLRSGRKPDVTALAAEHPELADDIRELAAAMAILYEIQTQTPGAATGRDATEGPPRAGQLGEFRILREIGRGGMGIVYEAEQISLHRRVALKVLPFAAVLDPRQLQRFKNEAQAAASLDHPNIVGIHSVGCERGVHYYAMQYIDGHTLAEIIAELRRGAARGGQQGARRGAHGARSEEQGARSEEQGAGGGEQGARRGEQGARSEEQGAGGAGASSPRPRAGEGDDVVAGLPTEPPTPDAPPSSPLAPHPSSLTSDTDRELQAKVSTAGSTRSREFFRSAANLGIQAAEALEHAHQMAGASLNNLATLARERGDHNEAEQLLKRAIECQKTALQMQPADRISRQFLSSSFALFEGVVWAFRSGGCCGSGGR